MASFEVADLLAPLIVLLLAAASLGLGLPIVRHLDRERMLGRGEGQLIAGLVGAIVLAHLVWVVGAWTYTRSSMALVLAASLLLSFGFFRQSRSVVWPLLPGLPAGLWGLTPWLMLGIVAVAFVGAYAPPSDHDTLRYHLTLPHRDLAWGKIAVYFGWSVYEFAPPLGGLLTRLAYALGGPTAAQLLHLMWEVVAAATAAAIAHRMGLKREYCWLAALLLLGQRVSINLASTASNEFALAAYAGMSYLAARHFLAGPNMRTAVLLGLVVGGLALVKFHGMIYAICLAVPVLAVALRGRLPFRPVATSGMIAILLVLPYLLRNWLVTGNPVFPAFNHLFRAGNVDVFSTALEISRTKAGIDSFLTLPWDLFVDQNSFDGLQFGLPVLLILVPFAWLAERRGPIFFMLTIVVVYLAFWVALMPQFIRFLVPLFPILAALAACGAQIVGGSCRQHPYRRWGLAGIALLLIIGQSGFLAATAARRLPPAMGLVSIDRHLDAEPFRYYAQFDACKWVMTRLRGAESYLPVLNSPTYYCPPERALSQLLPGDEKRIYTDQPRAAVSAAWLAGQLASCQTRYIIVAGNLGADSEPLVFAKHRYNELITRARVGLTPVFRSGQLGVRAKQPNSAGVLAFVYDARHMIEALHGIAASGDPARQSRPDSGKCQLLTPHIKLPWPRYE